MADNPYEELIQNPRAEIAPADVPQIAVRSQSSNPYENLVTQEPKPSQSPIAAQSQPAVGYTEDIAKSAAGGLGRGISGLIGLPGTAQDLVRSGMDYLLPPSQRQLEARRQVPNLLPSASTVQSAAEGVTGKFYEPKTTPGQYASTIAEFAPGAIVPGSTAARIANTVIPGALSETAGQITKNTAVEPYARAIGGVAGGVGAAKLITPTAPASAARQAAVNTLQGEGIPLTAGQRTGSRPLQWAESTAADMPGSAGRARDMQAAQKAAYDRAVTERLYDRGQLTARGVPADVNLPDPRVATAGRASLGDEYTRLSQANQLRADPQLFRDLANAESEYARRVLPSQRTRDVVDVRDEIADKLVQGLGRMPGEEYQAIRSQLGTNARGVANQPYLAGALRDMRGALDRAMQRGLSPDDAAAWALTNRRYANMRQIDPAVASAGENLSPARVAQTARTGRNAQYAQQQGDLDELSRAASIVMKDLPQSGTAPRTGMQTLFNLPTLLASGGGGALGSTFGPMGAVIGAAAPFAAARAVVSRPGQAYLGNQALPQRTRDVLAQTLAQQAISQPSGIERNRREREEYEKKRKNR